MTTSGYKQISLTCGDRVFADVFVKRGRERFYYCETCREWRKEKPQRQTKRRDAAVLPGF